MDPIGPAPWVIRAGVADIDFMETTNVGTQIDAMGNFNGRSDGTHPDSTAPV